MLGSVKEIIFHCVQDVYLQTVVLFKNLIMAVFLAEMVLKKTRIKLFLYSSSLKKNGRRTIVEDDSTLSIIIFMCACIPMCLWVFI